MVPSISKTIQRNILVGLAVVLPVVITLTVANWLFTFVTQIPQALLEPKEGLWMRGAVLLMLLMLLYLIGFFIRSLLGRKIYAMGERVLVSIPVINNIYSVVRQISGAIFSRRKDMFREVAMIEYPRAGLHCIAFVTSKVPKDFGGDLPGHDRVALFVPTTPNPTSGFLLFASRDEITPLPLTVQDAMKLIVSAGAVYPGSAEFEEAPDLLTKLEAWATHDKNVTPHTAVKEGEDA